MAGSVLEAFFTAGRFGTTSRSGRPAVLNAWCPQAVLEGLVQRQLLEISTCQMRTPFYSALLGGNRLM